MREIILFLTALFGSSVVAIFVLSVLVGAVVWFILWLLKPAAWTPVIVRYRSSGVVVHRAYSAEAWVNVYMPLPFPAFIIPGMDFLFFMPPPMPVLQRQLVPSAPHLLIVVSGVEVWMRCNDDAYQRWPNRAKVRVEYELRDGVISIVEAWWP
ncbi:MAG: hypothetical protein AAB467_01365 [Patescibacteria group bacterium]